MVTKAEAAEYEKKVFTFAESGIANPKVWKATKAVIETVEPKLVEDVEAKIAEILLAHQKGQIVVQLIPKDDRSEAVNYMELADEFLLCMNRANEISKEIFVTRELNLQGAGNGKKKQRKIELRVGDETLEFRVFRKIEGIAKKEETE